MASTGTHQHNHQPAYYELFRTGELDRRAEQAVFALRQCRLCPRQCGVDRWRNRLGVCRTGRQAQVASSFPHHGEQAVLRGRRARLVSFR